MKFNYKFNNIGCSLKSGIYEICNTHSGKYYIGQSKEFKSRWNGHKSALLNGSQKANRHMINDFAKSLMELGHHDFMEFRVIELLLGTTQLQREQREELVRQEYVQKYGRVKVYSKTVVQQQEHLWSSTPEITKEKLSQAHKELWQNPEYHDKVRTAQIQGWENHPESRKKQSEDQKKRLEDPVYRQQLSENSKQLWQDPEYIEKMKLNAENNPNFGMTGKAQSEETKEKIGKANSGKTSCRKGISMPEETKAKMRKKHCENWQDPAYREKMKQARTKKTSRDV